MIQVRTASPAETLALGRKLAPMLTAGDVILLAGRLGSGKTLFAAGVAEGLGVQGPVTSPTFVLVRSYDGFLPVVHADVYRLGTTAEFEDLELPTIAEDGVLMIEWGNAVVAGVPVDHLLVEISIVSDSERMFGFVGRGEWADRDLGELQP